MTGTAALMLSDMTRGVVSWSPSAATFEGITTA